jgi:two-component system phosphate regulon sensor histidine kinase PhoR
MCCLVAACGAVWLGWYCYKLTDEIGCVTTQMSTDNETARKGTAFFSISAIEQLSGAIAKRLADSLDDNQSQRQQVKQLQVEVKLSQRQKNNAEAIIYSIRDAVIVIDEFDKISMANEAAGKLFGFDYKGSLNSPIEELIGTDKNEFIAFLRQSTRHKVRATRRQINIVDEKLSLDEKNKVFDCIISCIYSDDEQVCGAVAVLHDVTREKEISEMKNNFVNHVSHELKTPLASITAYSEMLVDGEANDEQTKNEFYSVIQSQAQRLNRLIENILNTSRIESGLIKIDKQPVSLTILIEEQRNMISSYAQEKNIKVVSSKPIVFDRVNADKDMISQVIVNLLSNAVKYTQAGGTITIENEVDELEQVARVKITDTGVGIPEDQIEHVFDKFYRVGANKKQAKGTGLGLNLVKQIIEKAHSGQVFVSSKVGQGSTFGFELPLACKEKVEV